MLSASFKIACITGGFLASPAVNKSVNTRDGPLPLFAIRLFVPRLLIMKRVIV